MKLLMTGLEYGALWCALEYSGAPKWAMGPCMMVYGLLRGIIANQRAMAEQIDEQRYRG